MKIAIGSDHGGYELKKTLIELLAQEGHEVKDFGCVCSEPVDYPVFGFEVAEYVADNLSDRGILICKSGIGMSITANKVRGIRAALCLNAQMAVSSRKHNDANVLVLGANSIPADTAAIIVKSWLDTPFEGGRHKNRVDIIKNYEEEHMTIRR